MISHIVSPKLKLAIIMIHKQKLSKHKYALLLFFTALVCITYQPWITALSIILLFFYSIKAPSQKKIEPKFSIKKEQYVILTLSLLIITTSILHFTLPAFLGAFNYIPCLLFLLALLHSPIVCKHSKDSLFCLITAQIPLFAAILLLNIHNPLQSLLKHVISNGSHSIENPFFLNKNNLAIWAAAIFLLSMNALLCKKYSKQKKIILTMTMITATISLCILISRNSIISLNLAFMLQIFIIHKHHNFNRQTIYTVLGAMLLITSINISTFSHRSLPLIRNNQVISSYKREKALKNIKQKAKIVSLETDTTLSIELNNIAQNNGFKTYKDLQNTIESTRTNPANKEIRWLIYQYTLKHLFDHPLLGWGWQSFEENFRNSNIIKQTSFINNTLFNNTVSIAKNIHHPHNLYLTWAFEGGVLVFIGYMFLLVLILFRGWHNKDCLFFFSPLCLLLLSGFLDNLFFDPRINLLFIILVAWNYKGRYNFSESSNN